MPGSARRYAVAVAVALVLTIGVAEASGDVYVLNQQLPVTVTNPQAVQSLVVQALRELSSQNTANITDLGKLETNLASVADKDQVKAAIDAARLAAINSTTNGANDCNFLMGNASFSGYAAQVAQWREALIQQNLDWVSGAPTIGGQPDPAAVSSAAAFQRLDGTACREGVASAAVIGAGGCGASVKPGPNAGLDLDANKLFAPEAMSRTETQAAKLYFSRAGTPEPLPPLNPTDVANGDAGEIIARRDALLTRLGAVQWALGGVIARRQPWTTGSQSLESWANGTAAQMGGHIPQTKNGVYFPNGVSEIDFMHVHADEPMFDQKYIAATSAAGVASNIKALLRLVAFGNWMQFQRYKLAEQRTVLLGLLLAQTQEPTQRVGQTR